MVNFAVFNELSLPLDAYNYKAQFGVFFNLLREMSIRKISKLRMSNAFRNYEITNGVNFQQFIGQCTDRELKARISLFLADNIILVDSPLILDSEIDDCEEGISSSYEFEGDTLLLDGIVCADIFQTIAISFTSNEKWNTHSLQLTRNNAVIDVMHASCDQHLLRHNNFFEQRYQLFQLGVTRRNFYQRREEIFTGKIRLCEELEEQILTLNEYVFQKALLILMDIDSNRKNISDFDISPESERLSVNSSLRSMREFRVNGEKNFFSNHVKNFYHGYRMHYLEIGDKIYIGYLGTHLPT